MFYFKRIPINNLEIIKKKVLDIIPKKINNLYPIRPDLPELVPELKEELIRLKLFDWIRSISVSSFEEGEGAPHLDIGLWNYSFNIPLANCENTLLKFYDCKTPPILSRLPESGLTYNKYQDCVLLNELEMNDSYLVNVKIIHAICNYNNAPRMVLLFRLKPEFDCDAYLKSLED